MADGGGMSHGVKLAIGIVLLWFGGLCLFVAFMSGKVSSLITGKQTDASGKTIKDSEGNDKMEGPRNVSELLVRAADVAQAAAGSGNGSSSGGVVQG